MSVQPQQSQKVRVTHNGTAVSAEVTSVSRGGFCYRTAEGQFGFCAAGLGTWTPDLTNFGSGDAADVFSALFGRKKV